MPEAQVVVIGCHARNGIVSHVAMTSDRSLRPARGRPGLVGGLATAQQAAQGVPPRSRARVFWPLSWVIVLIDPLFQSAVGRKVIAARRAVLGSLREIAECLDYPLRAHVPEAESAHARRVDQPASGLRRTRGRRQSQGDR